MDRSSVLGGKTLDLENTDSLVPEEVTSGAGKSNITTARTEDPASVFFSGPAVSCF